MTPEVRQAFHDGIGSRLKALGFKRKSSRLYSLEDDELHIWTRLDLPGSSGVEDYDVFYDTTGILLKPLEAFMAKAPLHDGRFFDDVHPPGHISRSAESIWRESAEFEQTYGPRGQSLWKRLKKWLSSDSYPYFDGPFFKKDLHGWFPGDDPEGCAEFTRQLWAAEVEPWLPKMRDHRSFIEQYTAYRCPRLVQAVARAWLGDTEKARELLQDECEINLTTEEEIRAYLISKMKSDRDRREFENDVAKLLARDHRRLANTLELAEFLGISLDVPPFGPRS